MRNPSKAKRKGKWFESTVASMIAEAFSLTKNECHRATVSGITSWEYGDIYIRDMPLIVECKYHSTLDMRHLLQINNMVKKWWDQLQAAVEKYKKDFNVEPLPLLVVSKPYWPIFVITLKKDVISHLDDGYIVNGDYVIFFTDGFFKDTLPKLMAERGINNGKS